MLKETKVGIANEGSADERARMLSFIKKHSFCTFMSFNDEELFFSHINLIQRGDYFFGHLALNNPQAKNLKDGLIAIATFEGNESDHGVMMVHMQGRVLKIQDKNELVENLDALTEKYESDRVMPWSIDWNNPKFQTQLNGIVGFYIIPTMLESAVSISSKMTESSGNGCLYHNASLVTEVTGVGLANPIPVYTPSFFKENRAEILREFIISQKFCMVVIYGRFDHVIICHANLKASFSEPNKIQLQGVISTACSSVAVAGETLKAIVIYNGPHTYISPSFYKTQHSVPTWNYVTAHAIGGLKILACNPSSEHVLLSIEFESDNIHGKFKLNQNRVVEDRRGVISGLGESESEEDHKVRDLMVKFSGF